MSSTDSESGTSDGSLDVQIKEHKPYCDEIAMLLSQAPYITDQSRFLDELQSSHVLCSDDLILAVCGIARYCSVRGVLSKRAKKVINSMISSTSEAPSEEIAIFFCPRITNAPLKEVHEMYTRVYTELGTSFEYFLLASRLYAPDKKEHEELVSTFEEFAKDDLKSFPYCAEEVFLLSCRNRRNTEIDGVPFRLFLATRHELESFLSSFLREISKQ